MEDYCNRANRPQDVCGELFKVRIHELICRAVSGLRRGWSAQDRQPAAGVRQARAECLLIHEPSFLAWSLGLRGRAKPRVRGRGGYRLSTV